MKTTFLCSGYALFDGLALGDVLGDPAEPKLYAVAVELLPLAAELPENFVGALATVAPIVNRNEPRRALQGIHLCPEGIVATGGSAFRRVTVQYPLPDCLT